MGNKLTKSSAILMTALTLGTSTLSTAQVVLAETGVVKTAEAEAKTDISSKVQSTAKLEQTEIYSGTARATVSITGKVDKVAVGDYVEYVFNNTPNGFQDLDGSDVKASDGTVIGKFVFDASKSTPRAQNRYFSQHNEKPNSDATKQAVKLDQVDKYVYKIIFNDKAATLQNITYSLGFTDKNTQHLLANKSYTYKASIQSGGKDLVTTDVTVKKSDIDRFNGGLIPSDVNVQKNQTLNNMPFDTEVLVQISKDKPYKANDLFEVNLNDPALKFDLSKLTVGKKFSSISARGFYDESQVNPNGVILTQQQTANWEIVEVSDKKVVIKVLNDLHGQDQLLLRLSSLASPSLQRLNANQSSFGTAKVSTLNATTGQTFSRDVPTNLYGTNLSADGIKQLRSLTVKHVDTAGKEIDPGSSSNHNVGHNYTTSPVNIKGYKLKTTPGNAKGTLNDNTTVTYVYEQEVVTTVAPTTTTKATTVPTTVKPATPTNGGNTDPASGRNTTTTATTTAKPVTTSNPTTKSPTTTTVAPKKIITSFKDPNGKDLVPPTDGDKPKVDIPGYTYVKTTTDPNGNAIHHYEPTKSSTTVTPKKVTTYFKDPSGKDIVPPTEGDNPKRDIPGYTYVKTTVDPSGNVVHHYKPTPKDEVAPKKVTTYFKDDKGNEVKPPVDGDQPKANIPGYEYVETTVDPDGNIIHKYKKVDASTKEVKPLPKTGDASSLVGLIGTGLASMIGLVSFKRKK